MHDGTRADISSKQEGILLLNLLQDHESLEEAGALIGDKKRLVSVSHCGDGWEKNGDF